MKQKSCLNPDPTATLLAEQNYKIHDKKLLAIVKCFQQWRVYFENAKHRVVIYTNHKNLLYFTTTKVLNRRQVRWAKKLSRYNFKIFYRKDSENENVDALSRRSNYFEDSKASNEAILEVFNDDITYNKKYLITTNRVEHDNNLMNRIRLTTEQNEVTKKWLEHSTKEITVENEILSFEEFVFVSAKLRNEVIAAHHESKIYEHSEMIKIIEHIKRNDYFSEMRKLVEKQISICLSCNQNKHVRHKSYENMRTSVLLTKAWKSIVLFFIVKLSKSKKPMTKVEYDSILIVTNRLIKYCYFIAYHEVFTAENLAYMFLKIIIFKHEILDEMISNRDKLFKSKFWRSLMKQIEIHYKLSTIYHSQKNEQTERMNQILKQYLRHYVNYRQINWVTLLSIAQFIYNTTCIDITKISSFYANYDYNSNMLRHETTIIRKQKINVLITHLKDLQRDLTMNLRFLAQRSKIYYDKKRFEEIDFKMREKAFVLEKTWKQQKKATSWITSK